MIKLIKTYTGDHFVQVIRQGRSTTDKLTEERYKLLVEVFKKGIKKLHVVKGEKGQTLSTELII